MLGKWRIQRLFDRETPVEVSEKDGVRSLHLGSSTVQSSMKLADPVELVLSYTRAMMGFLLFTEAPKHALVIGLGGGSIVKYLYHRFPSARITVVESNPKVIAIARTLFFVPQDDERLRVVHGRGEEWVARHPGSCDVLMVDGYDGHHQVEALSTEDFYAAARSALDPSGALVVNLWASDRRFDAYLQRIERVFEVVVCLPAERRGNVIVLAFCRRPKRSRWADLRARARVLEAMSGLEFLRMVEALREANPHSDKALLFGPAERIGRDSR
ncbi:MAG TPA: polyamine aminopropyltransferase [Burkholderiales bacterium]|nr:polyamine aminopropyltransferase [Burkholderiales bacterium]